MYPSTQAGGNILNAKFDNKFELPDQLVLGFLVITGYSLCFSQLSKRYGQTFEQSIPFTVLFYPNEILLGPSEIHVIIYQSEFEFYLNEISLDQSEITFDLSEILFYQSEKTFDLSEILFYQSEKTFDPIEIFFDQSEKCFIKVKKHLIQMKSYLIQMKYYLIKMKLKLIRMKLEFISMKLNFMHFLLET